ncbi:MAG: response regulator [Desulfobacteraceae bacterium]|jgi:DNA-binding response OmpR family regulator
MPEKILIVDDEPNIVIPIQFLMEQNGYTVIVAFNGNDAIKAVSTFQPNLIILDLMLPGIDGFEICQRIRENADWSHIKIVIVTAMGQEANIAKGMALGADAYIVKPFSNAYMVQQIKSLLTDCR